MIALVHRRRLAVALLRSRGLRLRSSTVALVVDAGPRRGQPAPRLLAHALAGADVRVDRLRRGDHARGHLLPDRRHRDVAAGHQDADRILQPLLRVAQPHQRHPVAAGRLSLSDSRARRARRPASGCATRCSACSTAASSSAACSRCASSSAAPFAVASRRRAEIPRRRSRCCRSWGSASSGTFLVATWSFALLTLRLYRELISSTDRSLALAVAAQRGPDPGRPGARRRGGDRDAGGGARGRLWRRARPLATRPAPVRCARPAGGAGVRRRVRGRRAVAGATR